MKYLDLLQMYFERTNAFETLWTIYVTVVGALLAFFATRDRMERRVILIIMLGFFAFATVNLLALSDTISARNGLQQAISEYVPTVEDNAASMAVKAYVGDHLKPQPLVRLVVFHLTCDVLIAGMMWVITRAKNPSDRPNDSDGDPSVATATATRAS